MTRSPSTRTSGKQAKRARKPRKVGPPRPEGSGAAAKPEKLLEEPFLAKRRSAVPVERPHAPPAAEDTDRCALTEESDTPSSELH